MIDRLSRLALQGSVIVATALVIVSAPIHNSGANAVAAPAGQAAAPAKSAPAAPAHVLSALPDLRHCYCYP